MPALATPLRPVAALGVLALVTTLVIAAPVDGIADAATPPSGFVQTTVATDIQNPVGMEIAPDGRLFVLAGNQRRIELFDDSGYLGDFLSLPQAANLGSGLLGLEFDPDFATSGGVLVSYVTDPDVVPGPQRFRLSRFASDGAVADPASEQVLFEVEDIDPSQQQHQGGDVGYGPDGKLYWTLGDRVEGTVVAQSLDSMFGKVLRLNADGTIPTDNPFFDQLDGDLRAIHGYGLRNPFRMEAHPVTRELFMSEVGPTDWEELNQVEAGANFGWPEVSGVANDPRFTDPVHAYNHTPDGCAITGGAFQIASANTFPAEYQGDFFYGDHCFGWIAHVDLETGEDRRFLTGADRLVEIKVDPVDGDLYFLDREYNGDSDNRKGGIGRISYVGTGTELEITRQPQDTTVAQDQTATFEVEVIGDGPFSYAWSRDGQPVGDDAARLTVGPVGAGDDGAQFSVTVTDGFGATVTSRTAGLTVTANAAPVPEIIDPRSDTLYVAGQTYSFSGAATDAEDGDLPDTALSWSVVFHHDEHTHPFIPELNDVSGGSFTVPTNDETDPVVWFRIHLTATDSDGVSTTVVRDVHPTLSDVTLATDPGGLGVLLDGTPVATPTTFTGVVGVTRVLEAPATASQGGATLDFASWSDGGARQHAIATPASDTTYTASYDGGVDQAPTITLGAPSGGAVVSAPLVVSGAATDDVGVEQVQVIVKREGTRDYWDGTAFTPGWSAIDATLASPGGTSTDWSTSIDLPEDVGVRITVRSVDALGQRSLVESANVTVIAGGEEPVAPVMELTSHVHKERVGNPVTISGTVVDDDAVEAFVVIKRQGAKEYWDGTAWTTDWNQLAADVTGDTWSYELLLDTPVNVIVFGRAVDSTGLKAKTDRVLLRTL